MTKVMLGPSSWAVVGTKRTSLTCSPEWPRAHSTSSGHCLCQRGFVSQGGTGLSMSVARATLVINDNEIYSRVFWIFKKKSLKIVFNFYTCI